MKSNDIKNRSHAEPMPEAPETAVDADFGFVSEPGDDAEAPRPAPFDDDGFDYFDPEHDDEASFAQSVSVPEGVDPAAPHKQQDEKEPKAPRPGLLSGIASVFNKNGKAGKTGKRRAADEKDFELNDDDFQDISGGISSGGPAEDETSADALDDYGAKGPDMAEFLDGDLSKNDEGRIFATQNISVIPKKVEREAEKPSRPSSGWQSDEYEPAGETYEQDDDTEDRKAKFKKRMKVFWKVWSIIRIPVIIAATVLIVYGLLRKVGTKLLNDYIMPVDPNDPTPIVVTIPTGSGASNIAKILYEAGGEGEKGLISHKAVFKVYVDFIGKSSRLQAGTYILSRNMSIPDIVDTICRGVPPREIVKLRVPEGMTIEAMAAKLVEDGILSSPDHFIELCVTGEAFVKDHPFIADIPADESGERPYALEGFLFPDTYEIYVDSNEETIIDKMLSRFEQIFGSVYTARAAELGLSMYQVVTLASTIEKEARLTDDFARVSAVFFNRIRNNMSLDSDATLEYVLHTGSLHLTDEQLATVSGYNTHTNTGLPLGPVSNPGDIALKAVLYPNEEFLSEQYLFFCLMDPDTGALVYAKTISEHNANVAKYSPLW